MRPPRLVAFGIIGETRRIERQLFGHESQHRDRWRFALPQGPPWKSQVTEQDGEPESIGIATPPIDQRQILGIQGVMTDDPALVSDRFHEGEPLRLGQEFSTRHGRPF